MLQQNYQFCCSIAYVDGGFFLLLLESCQSGALSDWRGGMTYRRVSNDR